MRFYWSFIASPTKEKTHKRPTKGTIRPTKGTIFAVGRGSQNQGPEKIGRCVVHNLRHALKKRLDVAFWFIAIILEFFSLVACSKNVNTMTVQLKQIKCTWEGNGGALSKNRLFAQCTESLS